MIEFLYCFFTTTWLLVQLYLIYAILRIMRDPCCPPPVYGYCGRKKSTRKGTGECPNFYEGD